MMKCSRIQTAYPFILRKSNSLGHCTSFGIQQRFKIDFTSKQNFNKKNPKTSDILKNTLGVYDDYKPRKDLTEEQKKEIFEKETSPEGPAGIPSWKLDISYTGKTPQDVLKNLDLRTWVPDEIMWERMKLDFPDDSDHLDFLDELPDSPPKIMDQNNLNESVFPQILPKETEIKRINNISHGVGGRKNSKANVFITPGKGIFMVNGMKLIDYFSQRQCRTAVLQPLIVTETLDQFNVNVRVSGGGFTGQSEAIRYGLTKALQAWDPQHTAVLKFVGFDRKDVRVVERKKSGQKKARKKFQWAKR